MGELWNRLFGNGDAATESVPALPERPVLARLDEAELRNLREQKRLATDAEKVARMLRAQYQQTLAGLLERYDLPPGCVLNDEKGVIYGGSPAGGDV